MTNDRPAILGGIPAVSNSNTQGTYPPIGQRERTLVAEVLDSGVLWAPWSPKTRELESRWANRLGVRYCCAVNSGTAALHCAIAGSGLGPGDEVLVPAWSFPATAAAVAMTGAQPVFVDVQAETGNLDPLLVQSSWTQRTRGMIVVHLHGLPADLDPLLAITTKHRALLIEDCAQAHGAIYRGHEVGTCGIASAFSLNATKLLAGPEGGLFCTDDDGLLNLAAGIRVFGDVVTDTGCQYLRDPGLCFNYRTNELTSAFALARLESFDRERRLRIDNARVLLQGLADLEGIQVPVVHENREHVFQMFRIRLDPCGVASNLSPARFRAKVLEALRAEGMQWYIWQDMPIPAMKAFCSSGGRPAFPGLVWQAYDASRFPVSASTAADALYTSAHFPPAKPYLMERYVAGFRKVWSALDDVLKCDVEPTVTPYQETFL